MITAYVCARAAFLKQKEDAHHDPDNVPAQMFVSAIILKKDIILHTICKEIGKTVNKWLPPYEAVEQALLYLSVNNVINKKESEIQVFSDNKRCTDHLNGHQNANKKGVFAICQRIQIIRREFKKVIFTPIKKDPWMDAAIIMTEELRVRWVEDNKELVLNNNMLGKIRHNRLKMQMQEPPVRWMPPEEALKEGLGDA